MNDSLRPWQAICHFAEVLEFSALRHWRVACRLGSEQAWLSPGPTYQLRLCSIWKSWSKIYIFHGADCILQ